MTSPCWVALTGAPFRLRLSTYPGRLIRAGVVGDRRSPRGSAGARGACRSTGRCERRASRVRTSPGLHDDVAASSDDHGAEAGEEGSPTWGDAASPATAERWLSCRLMTSA